MTLRIEVMTLCRTPLKADSFEYNILASGSFSRAFYADTFLPAVYTVDALSFKTRKQKELAELGLEVLHKASRGVDYNVERDECNAVLFYLERLSQEETFPPSAPPTCPDTCPGRIIQSVIDLFMQCAETQRTYLRVVF